MNGFLKKSIIILICSNLLLNYIDSQTIPSQITSGLTGTVSSLINSTTSLLNGTTPTGADVNGIVGNMTGIVGNVTGLVGNVTGLIGNVTGIDANGLVNNMTGLINNITDVINPVFDINSVRNSVLMIPLIDPKPATSYATSSDLNNDFQNATQRLNGEFGLYYLNNCTDDRVKTLFNVEPASDDGNSYCQQLVMDWTQMYDKYQSNDWFCNNQGKCSFKLDDNNFVNPSCQCNSGFYGQNCMFNTTTFSNADKWISTIQTWLTNYLTTVNGTITDKSVFEDILSMTENVILVTSNAETKDAEKYGNIVASLITPILSAQVNITSDLQDSLYGFMDFIFSKVDSSLSGVDPNLVVSMSNDPVKTTDTYDLQNTVVDPEADLNLDPKSASKTTSLRFLEKFIELKKQRFMTAVSTKAPLSKTPAKKVLNTDSAKVTIFKDATKSLGKINISFVANKDPKSFNSATSVSMSSYVITLKATSKTNNSNISYPTGVSAMQMYIPWLSVPLTIPNNDYVKNCKVYSFDTKNWNPTSSCSVLTNSTSAAAAVSCNTFGTLGVSCSGATAKRTGDSTFVSSLSYFIYIIIGLILF